MSNMQEFIQRVRVVGVDEAVREMRELGVNTENLGKKTKHAGQESSDAGSKFFGFGNIVKGIAQQAKAMVTGFLGLSAVVSIINNLIANLEKVRDVQRELTESAVEYDSTMRKIAGQLGVSTNRAQLVSTQVRAAGGLSRGAAESLIISSDIAMRDEKGGGGLLAGGNLAITREIAGYAGAKDFNESATGDLVDLLKSANRLKDVQTVKQAVAMISAASDSSRAANVGEFVQIAKAGGEGLLQAGVPLEDVLMMAVQARQVELSPMRSAHSLEVIQQLAIGGAEEKFNKEMAKVAADRGLDLATMSSADKVQLVRDIFAGVTTQEDENRLAEMISPERYLRMLKTFRGSNVTTTAGTSAVMAAARPENFDAVTREYQNSISYRRASDDAWDDLHDAMLGRELFSYNELRLRAEKAHKRAVASGETSEPFIGWGEYQVEKRMMDELISRRNALAYAGYDLSEFDQQFVEGVYNSQSQPIAKAEISARGMIDRIPPTVWGFFGKGYRDSLLRDLSLEIDDVSRQQRLDTNAKIENQLQAQTVINIGTQYNDNEPGRFPSPETDLSD